MFLWANRTGLDPEKKSRCARPGQHIKIVIVEDSTVEFGSNSFPIKIQYTLLNY